MNGQLSSGAFEELVNLTADIISVVDEFGVIQYENESTRRIVGYEAGDRVGDSVFQYIHPDDLDHVVEEFQKSVDAPENTTTRTVEYRLQHEDGSWVWVETRGTNLTTSEIDGYVVVTRDISQRKEFEDALRAERDRLERFAGIISHDLRNPMNVIRSRLELAQDDMESEHFEPMERSLDRMDMMIEDLLTLAREGGTEPLLDATNLKVIVDECWKNVATEGATLTVEAEEPILADHSQLQQLLENLIRNTVEHGEADVTVTIGTLEDGFYVEDDGPGIPEDVRDSVFAYGYSTKDGGTGFGLNIVQEIAGNHGWDIHLTEGTAGGARFEFTNVDFA